jgi:hypothetical protein
MRCIAWSPDYRTIALGSSDTNIYLFESDSWALKGVLKGSKYGVASLDFSTDAVFLRSCCFGPRDDEPSVRGVGGGACGLRYPIVSIARPSPQRCVCMCVHGCQACAVATFSQWSCCNGRRTTQ